MYNPPVNISDKRWSKRIHNALPSFMNQNDNSNNQKVLDIDTEFANKYKNDDLDITNQTLVQNAKGSMLDRLCHDWGVDIVDENDDDFKRFQIRFQMLRHRLGPGGVKNAIAFLFSIRPSSFNIVSTGIKAIKVTNLPFDFDTGDKTILKRKLIARCVRGMLPPEYELQEIDYRETITNTIYLGIGVTIPPIIESVAQSMDITESSRFGIHQNGWTVPMITAHQEYPPIKEVASSNLINHSTAKIRIKKAIQNRKDQ